MSSLFAHSILSLGIVALLSSFVISVIPKVGVYKMPVQLVGMIVAAYGFWLEGGLAYKQKVDLQIAQLETQLAQAKAKADRASDKTIIKYLQGPDVIKYDTTCVIPKEIVAAHNAAATLTPVPEK